MSIRNKRRLITWGYIIVSTFILSIPITASSDTENSKVAYFFIFLLIANLVTSRWTTRIIQQSLITVGKCPNCSTLIDLIAAWKCRCGYTSTQHIFKRCSNCKEYFGYTACPKCEVSIDV